MYMIFKVYKMMTCPCKMEMNSVMKKEILSKPELDFQIKEAQDDLDKLKMGNVQKAMPEIYHRAVSTIKSANDHAYDACEGIDETRATANYIITKYKL